VRVGNLTVQLLGEPADDERARVLASERSQQLGERGMNPSARFRCASGPLLRCSCRAARGWV
jgi:hypothetical protein